MRKVVRKSATLNPNNSVISVKRVTQLDPFPTIFSKKPSPVRHRITCKRRSFRIGRCAARKVSEFSDLFQALSLFHALRLAHAGDKRSAKQKFLVLGGMVRDRAKLVETRSEEHTSELQSH